jgi:GDPmannose 4,6-dehydratase
VRLAFAELGIVLTFEGKGIQEVGKVVQCLDKRYELPLGKIVVAVHERYFRPAEVDLLLGDATKAREKLGWKPKYSLADMVKQMVAEDLRACTNNKPLDHAENE